MSAYRDVAAWCEHREGTRGGTATVLFPNHSRAKWDANVIGLVRPVVDVATDTDEWKQCDVCDRIVARDDLQAYEEGDACGRCCRG